ncbi:MAG: bifunctional aspartate kinase/homoserine dehydrogenase I, partial [Bacteroidota bacterium]
MILLKFGGSSVKTAERISGVISILKSYHQAGKSFAVVFSAFGGVTDSIIEMSKMAAEGNAQYLTYLELFKKRHIDTVNELMDGPEKDKVLQALQGSFIEMGNLLQGVFLVRDLTKRTQDYLLSFGERNSAYVISQALQTNEVPSNYLDARKVIQTDDTYGAASVDFDRTTVKIQSHFTENDAVQVITGFVASTENGITTTLGRGGSDYTCAIFAAALDAQEIEIWTDVDGVMTADPRKVSKAFSIPSMTYSEAMEMSHFGAKVIYPPTIQPALDKQIPIRIKNTFNPGFEGTLISAFRSESGKSIKGISSIPSVNLLTLEGPGLVGTKGSAARLFGTLARNGVNIIMITQGSSEYAINFAIRPGDTYKAQKAVSEEFQLEIDAGLIKPLKVETELSIIAVIGENMRFEPGIAGRIFHALGTNGINIVGIAQGSSELNISVVIGKQDETKAINAIHESFFLSDTKVIHIFSIGVGLIGGTLLEQIRQQATFLEQEQALEIRVVGISNSKKMLFNTDGIDLENWKSALLAAETPMSFEGFVDKMKALNLRNSIFIDNTANKEIVRYYPSILDSSISISTPNKIAVSSDYQSYLNLKGLAQKRGVHLAYETNVGAGLPVLTTLRDLITSGDHIQKIEGVLSGSLSFIFNSFHKDIQFSEIVKEAQAAGYTEPDPREDLSGADVRRKLLILARESGYAYESEDIEVKGILPEECMTAPDVPAFFEALEANDDHFSKLIASAEAEGK